MRCCSLFVDRSSIAAMKRSDAIPIVISLPCVHCDESIVCLWSVMLAFDCLDLRTSVLLRRSQSSVQVVLAASALKSLLEALPEWTGLTSPEGTTGPTEYDVHKRHEMKSENNCTNVLETVASPPPSFLRIILLS